jgi:UDP-glucose 4-epimerase
VIVLVTGGAGFIGSWLATALLRAGHSVRVLDNFSTGRRENLLELHGVAELLDGDVRAPEAVARAVTGCEVVFHQAALPSVPRSILDPLTTHGTNVVGTLNVLLAARDAGVRRVLYASSSSIYGPGAELPAVEGQPALPISPYAISKLAGEGYARSFADIYGLETVSLRYFNVYGPRQDPASEYAAVIPRLIQTSLGGEAPVVFGDGEQSRDFTFVADVVRANLLSMDAASVSGGVFNVAGGERITVNRLCAEVRDVLGSKAFPIHEPERSGEIRHMHADLALARMRLGYEPQVGLREGLLRTAEHLRRLAKRRQAGGHAPPEAIAGR